MQSTLSINSLHSLGLCLWNPCATVAALLRSFLCLAQDSALVLEARVDYLRVKLLGSVGVVSWGRYISGFWLCTLLA